jgi:hypothetical protein
MAFDPDGGKADHEQKQEFKAAEIRARQIRLGHVSAPDEEPADVLPEEEKEEKPKPKSRAKAKAK